MQIIDGKKIAERMKDALVKTVAEQNNGDIMCPIRPLLAIILVGERADSELYVSLKEKEAKKVGVDTSLYRLSPESPMKELEELIAFLNKDEATDGILLQLPLPGNFDTNWMVSMIDPDKDVDYFHPQNIKHLGQSGIWPPLVQVVTEIFDEIKYNSSGKEVCVIANSNEFGSVMSKVLTDMGASVKVVSPDNEDLSSVASSADVLITAVGRPGLIKGEHVKKGALIIDVGITKGEDGKVRGDVDAESVKDKAEWLTPVPGGVGPITIAAALKNVVEMWKKKNDKQ